MHTYKNAVVYKESTRQIAIIKLPDTEESEDVFCVSFKRLIVLTPEQKILYTQQNNTSTHLHYREHSKYCIWQNDIRLSLLALECLHNSLSHLHKLEA